MTFHSILFEDRVPTSRGALEAPSYFTDLNLDQIVAAITAGFKEYELTPLYCERLSDIKTIRYRQEIMRDLGDATVMQSVKAFSEKMRLMRGCLSQSKQFHYYKHAMTPGGSTCIAC